jgi:hypothetical protein
MKKRRHVEAAEQNRNTAGVKLQRSTFTKPNRMREEREEMREESRGCDWKERKVGYK